MKKCKVSSVIKYIILLILAFVYLVPVIMMLLGSVKDPAQALQFDLSWPKAFHFENYQYVIENGNILRGYLNSATITFSATALTIIFGAFAGIIISRRSDKTGTALYYYFIFGLTMTLQTASTFALLKVLNLYGSRFAVISIYIGMRMPFTIMSFSSFIKGIPREIDEAAMIDGCKPFGMITQVLMPILKPITVANIVITAISCWNDFMIPLFYLGSGKKWTVTLAVYNFFGMFSRNWNYVFAVLTLTVLPIVIMFLFLQKYIVSGMTAGAIKG